METSIQDINCDNLSVVSDITDFNSSNTISSLDIEDKINEIKIKLNADLNKFNTDLLKDKCKELGISGVSKLKKPELIPILETEFLKLIPILREKKVNELKNIRKQCGIKKVSDSKKDEIIYQILLHYSSNMIFRLVAEVQNGNEKEKEKEETIFNVEPVSLIEQLEKQKLEIEIKLKEEAKKIEEDKKKKDEEERLLKEEEERVKKEEEKKEAKKKKQSIPKNVRIIVWNHYIGEDIIKHKCLCCKKVTISNTNFEVGHVQSEKNGGTHEINNLRPICFSCNHSMGPENMIDFVVKYGLYIG
jgi:5-methylcytosine-specific restriction endonuclease McrA